jgi:hypothetical protein
MQIKLTFIIVLAIGMLTTEQGYSQGCSDAGFCSLGGLKARHAADKAGKTTRKQQLSLFLPVGIGDEEVTVFTPGLQYDNQLSANWGIQAKLTANVARGDLANISGPGDIFLSASYRVPSKSVWTTLLSLGVKLPLNDGNLKSGNLSLPMQYQSSLGTTDLIAGISVSNIHWQFAVGLQQPFTSKNGNSFLPVSTATAKFAPTNAFERKGDVLLRAAYNGNVSAKLNVNGGILAIVHLGEDSYKDVAGQRKMIAGSDGLTLNLTAGARWAVNDRFQVGLTGGVPVVVRDVRPDGLTRKFVLAPELIFHF